MTHEELSTSLQEVVNALAAAIKNRHGDEWDRDDLIEVSKKAADFIEDLDWTINGTRITLK